ncbi:MAG: ribonuclease HI family protein [Candidatus Berkelbacteria bacterium]|nr:ribonuclease HI family protein [Candidatus Berkelbacteria bacterium]
MKTIFVYSDGGSFNNPGPSGIGVVICDSNKVVLKKISEYIGEATNNQAEYQAVIRALEEVRNLKRSEEIECKVLLDSELIVNQLNLKYKIKNTELQPLFLKAHNLSVEIGNVSFVHIPREQNKEADRLVKRAIKEASGV